MRGPESTFEHHIRWSSGYNSLSSYCLASIGWHHCRAWNSISPHDWSTVMWPVLIGYWHRVSPAINNQQGRTRNAIGPCNWSTVMWPVPIGWWRRVSPAIYTTLTQDLGFFVVGSLSIVRWLVSPRSCTHPCTGSTVHFRQQPLLRESSSRVSVPPLHSIPCTTLESAQPRPEVWSARWCATLAYHVQRTCNKYISGTRVETVFVLFLNWDLKYTGLVTNLGPVPFVPWGTTRRVWWEGKNTHNEKASTAQSAALAVGVKE